MPRAKRATGYSNALRTELLTAVRFGIGQELETYYEPPRKLSADMFLLLMLLKERLEQPTERVANRNKS
jgi:hypothetical protein